MPGLHQFVWLLMAAAYAQQNPARPAAMGSIEGQVVNARTGAPLKRAMVRLVGTVIPAAAAAAATAAVATPAAMRPVMINRETDEQGRFAFTNLDPGKYLLTAERQGFLRQNWGAHKYSGGSAPVVVAEGQAVKGIDFRLSPQAVITGTVLDEDGEPMAGVQVRAQRSYLRNGQRVWVVASGAVTSDIGEYRLPALKPGRYAVVAAPRPNGMNLAAMPSTEPLPATPETTYTATYYPSTVDAGSAVPVDVGEGVDVPDVDIRLLKMPVFRVRGRVLDMPVAPNNGRGGGVATVILTPRDSARRGDGTLLAQARAPEGEFEIRNVPSGQYLAHAQTQMGAQQYLAMAAVDVIGGHADGVTLRLSPGVEVRGTVKLVDATGPVDLQKVQVLLVPVGFAGQSPRAVAGENGEFTLKSVPPAAYTVTVTGFPDTCYVKNVQYGGADIGADGADMTGGGVVEVVLSGGAARVDAVVTAAEEKAVAGAQVLVLRDGAPASVHAADESGMLTLRGLKPGSYRILAWEDVDPEQLWDPDYLRKFESEGKSVRLDNGGHEAIQLKAIAAQ